MLRILTHIEQLLRFHDCVIVPGLGGFVLQSVPAVYNSQEHRFLPMHKEIIFNSTLQHNDGLLLESYMRAYQADSKKAFIMLEEDVERLKESLYREKRMSLGVVGSFVISQEGQIVFKAGDNSEFSLDSYGLPVFNIKTLEVIQPKPVLIPQRGELRKDTVYIPINKKFLKVVGSSAAAIALFLLLSKPVEDVQSTYSASFIPKGIIMPAETPVDTENVLSLDVEEVVISPSEEKIEVAPVVKNPKMYHAIIGSLQTEEQADDFLLKVDKALFPNVNKITRNGKIRVYVDKFDNKQQAEQYIDQLRIESKYKDAWLFASR